MWVEKTRRGFRQRRRNHAGRCRRRAARRRTLRARPASPSRSCAAGSTPICPVLRTWVPPQAFRSKSRMSISRSFSRSASGNLAHAHRARFIGRGEANFHRTVFGDDFVRQPLGGCNCFGVTRRSRDRWCSSRRPCGRNGREVVQLLESGRENVLSGVLLHVVAAPLGIDHAANDSARAIIATRLRR